MNTSPRLYTGMTALLLEVPCAVKPAVFLTVGGATTGGSLTSAEPCVPQSSSGCQVVDIAVHPSAPRASHRVDFITFQNYYTYSVTVLSRSGQAHESSWQLYTKEQRLMANCHYERGGQDWVTLKGAESASELHDIMDLRLILRQPSPHWRVFGVREVRCYTVNEEGGPHMPSGSGRSQLEIIAERMQNIQDIGQSPGGCGQSVSGRGKTVEHTQPKLPYEVNLLSYT